MKNKKITLSNYSNLLTNIENCIKQAGEKIARTSVREKVVMSWKMGKLISEDLSKNNHIGYKETLLAKLEKDLLIKKRTLYKMRNFYQSYPKLPKDEVSLNWSHYRVLAEIKNDEKRKYLESLTIENNWNVIELERAVKNSKKNSESSSAEVTTKNSDVIRKTATTTKLRPERGQLFSYPLVKDENTEKTYIDCGFNIFREVEESLPKNLALAVQKPPSRASTVDVSKKKENYSFEKSDTSPRKFNTYKAYLDRVVDGDTIRVTIDLGFKLLHKEIIRLKGIDAPEIGTDEGKKSSKMLSKILNGLPFLIVKTIKIDIYGRYVADVFLPPFDSAQGAVDSNPLPERSRRVVHSTPQQVADNGIYLNQLLLNNGSAQILKM